VTTDQIATPAPASPPRTGGRHAASRDNPASPLPPWRIVSAKFLELRRRRGLLVALMLLTLGILVVIDVIFIILHAASPHSYGPAGGLSKFRGFAQGDFPQTFGIAGILVGAAAGSSALTEGVFRHLVVTGRSRLAIFFSWIPAGLMVLLPITALAYAVEAVVAVYFAPSGPVQVFHFTQTAPGGGGGIVRPVLEPAAPSVHLLVVVGLWLMLQTFVAFVLGVGLGSLTGSRYVTVAILIALQLIVTPILSSVTIPHLINLQRAFVGVAIAQLEPSGLSSITGPGGGNQNLLQIAPMPTFGLAIVVTAWVVGWLFIGARRTLRRDV
jgi:hypothetical protein